MDGGLDGLVAALDQQIGLLAEPTSDATTPDGYNENWRTLLANTTGLYRTVDRLEAVLDALVDQNRQDLQTIEQGLRELKTIRDATERAQSAKLDWNGIFWETFSGGEHRDADPNWYKAANFIDDSLTTIETHIPAWIDPTDRALKLQPGGDFVRSTSLDGIPLADAVVEECLGLSSDSQHELRMALDGRYDTYWRESIEVPSPLQGSTTSQPWLPDTYRQGAAVRLYFRFPHAVPISDVQIRPFSRYPMHVLQVAWSNRQVSGVQYATNGNFASSGTGWTVSTPSGAAISYPSGGSYASGSSALLTHTSGRTTLANTSFALSGITQGLHVQLKSWRTQSMQLSVLVEWTATGSVAIRNETYHVPSTSGEWHQWDKLVLVPSGCITGGSGAVTLVIDGTGTVRLTDFKATLITGLLNLDKTLPPEADALSIQTHGAICSDVWVVVGQPHYEFRQVPTDSSVDYLERFSETSRQNTDKSLMSIRPPIDYRWRVQKSRGRDYTATVPLDGGTALEQEARRTGGWVRNMIARLKRLTAPPSSISMQGRFCYELGAWEIQLRHREYAPQGLWVSLPYEVRREIRSLAVVTNPSIAALENGVRFWLTARANDGPDKAKQLSSVNGETFARATFQAAGETQPTGSYSNAHFTLSPAYRRDSYEGTNHNATITLDAVPYLNRETIRTVHTSLTSGFTQYPIDYDPNQTIYYLPTGSTYTKISGYRPIQVTLQFQDGTIALPDSLGRIQPGEITYVAGEVLQSVTAEDAVTNDSGDAIVLPEAFLARVERLALRQPVAVRQQFRDQKIAAEIAKRKAARTRRNARRATNRTIVLTAVQTQYPMLAHGPAGVSLSLYWHKSTDRVASGLVTSGDVLINPARYLIDTDRGIVTVFARQPSGNTSYDSYVAYYYYERTELLGRDPRDERSASAQPTSGLDWVGPQQQRFPITRNVTDYLYGIQPTLKIPVLDDLREDYYPVFEYWIDDQARLHFPVTLHAESDTPATVLVEYSSLEIAPRLIVEFIPRSSGGFATYTPVLYDYTIVTQGRTL